MAGPGGGPPRRSHTKSRKGCETCKRRHIRCDETFPQCRNCTKHKIRCPYNDIPVQDDRSSSPDRPSLMWTPEIEAQVDEWRRTGVFPFAELNIFPSPDPQNLTVEELRLIHHVASISSQLGAIDANGFTLWTRQIPTIIRIGATHDYVLHALLAFSAMHIAFLTSCPAVGNMGYEHRGIALKGLKEAIGTFSRESSDAVLAASLVLSWQATDWRSWTQLMQGTSTVIGAMDAWKHESQFGEFIAESSTFPTAPPSPTADHKPSQPGKADMDAYQRTLQQLQQVEAHLKHNREDTKSIQQLIGFLKGAKKCSPTSLAVDKQFDRLQPLRTWLFWLPVSYLEQTRGSPSALVIIAHYYTVALLMERLFPEIGAAYFGSLTIGPLEEIARRLLSINLDCGHQSGLQTPLAMMEFPIDTVNEFRSRMGWHQPARTPSFPQFHPPNFYAGEYSPVSLPASVSVPSDYVPYGPYGLSPAFSYSTDDLSSLPFDSTPNSAASPLRLSPSFTNSQYLNIPSSYAASAYSPASSTFEYCETSSVAYSDQEEYGPPYGLGLAPSTPVMGDHHSFGIGTPNTMHLSTTPSQSPPGFHGFFPDSSFSERAPSPFLALEQTYTSSPVGFLAPPSEYCHRRNLSTVSAPPTLPDQANSR